MRTYFLTVRLVLTMADVIIFCPKVARILKIIALCCFIIQYSEKLLELLKSVKLYRCYN